MRVNRDAPISINQQQMPHKNNLSFKPETNNCPNLIEGNLRLRIQFFGQPNTIFISQWFRFDI